MSIIDVLSLTIGLTTGAAVLVGVGILYRFHVLTQSYVRALAAFAVASGDQPSNMALLWDSMVERAIAKLSMGQLGRSSGDARREKSAQIEMIKATVGNEQPVVAMALNQFFPKWGKMLADNPEILPQMMEFMNKKMGGAAAVPAESNGRQQRFQL